VEWQVTTVTIRMDKITGKGYEAIKYAFGENPQNLIFLDLNVVQEGMILRDRFKAV